MKIIEPETCPRCGDRFHCSKSAKCWCYELNVEASLLEIIQDNWNTCLCPKCLNELNKKSQEEGIVDLFK